MLVGGEGTRLRPITSRVPKPVVPLVGRPFVGYILENLARHGVQRAVFSAGYLADALRGRDRRRRALRPGRALRGRGRAAGHGRRHQERRGRARRRPLLRLQRRRAHRRRPDARMARLRTRGAAAWPPSSSRRSTTRAATAWSRSPTTAACVEFLEKPGAEYARAAHGALINAGVYVLEPEVLEMIPAGRMFSIERGVFPRAGRRRARSTPTSPTRYWRDIGTPESYLQAHFDMLQSTVATSVASRLGRRRICTWRPTPSIAPGAQGRAAGVRRRRHDASPPAAAWGRSPWSAPAARSRAGAEVHRVGVQDGVAVGAACRLERSVVVSGASIGAGQPARERRHRRGLPDRRRQRASPTASACIPRRCSPTAPSSSASSSEGGGPMTVSPEASSRPTTCAGLYPQELDAEGAQRIGAALAQQLGARTPGRGPRPAASRRPSSPRAFAAGAAAAGAAVTTSA